MEQLPGMKLWSGATRRGGRGAPGTSNMEPLASGREENPQKEKSLPKRQGGLPEAFVFRVEFQVACEGSGVAALALTPGGGCKDNTRGCCKDISQTSCVIRRAAGLCWH